MAATLSDIQLNIIVNVRNAQSLQALTQTLNAITSRATAMGKANAAAARGTRQLADEHRTLKGRLDATEKNYDALFRASYRLMNVGYQLVGMAREMFQAITDMTDLWGKFEFMTNRAAGALQVWRDTGSTLNPIYESLIQNLLSASKELRLFPAEEVAKATYFWASTSGQAVRSMDDLRVLMEAVNPLMKVAALTQTSYETAIKGTYSILVQYGKSLSDVDDVTSKLFLATQRTALEFGDLINSFKYVGPTANALGITFEEVTQVLGALGDAGIRGSQSGRGLRQLFIRLVKPPKEAAKALELLFRNTKELGKGFDELIFPNGKFVGITNYVNYLAIALKDATVAERNHLYAVSSTANELPVITALVENQIKRIKGLAGAYDETKSSVTDSANAAMQFKRNWDLLSESWIGLTERLKRGVEVIKIQVGRVLAGALANTVKNLTDFLDRIERWVRRNPALVRNLGSLGASLAALAGVAGGLFLLSGALLGVYAAIQVIVRGFGPLVGVAGTVIGGIALIAESVVENWTRIQRVVVPAFNRFIAALTGGQGTIQGIRTEWERLHAGLKTVVDIIVRTAIGALASLLDLMTAIAESPLRGVFETIGRALVLAFGLRTLAMVTGLAAAIGAFFKVLMIVKSGSIATAIQMRLMGVGAIFASRSVKGLTLALQTMSRTTVLVIITAIITAFQLLHDLLPGVSEMFNGAGRSIHDMREEMEDFYAQIGPGAEKFRKTIETIVGSSTDADEMYQIYKTEFARIHGLLQENDFIGHALVDWAPFGPLADLKKKMEDAARVVESGAQHFKAQIEGVANDSERSVTEVYDVLSKYGSDLFGDLAKGNNLEQAIGFVRSYYKTLGDETEVTVKSVVTLWNDMIKNGIKPSVSAAEFVKMMVPEEALDKWGNELAAKMDLQRAKVALQTHNWNLAFGILNGLKTDADRYSGEFNTTVNEMLSEIPQAISTIQEEASSLMSETPGEILQALIDGFKSLGNIKDRFSKAVKQKIKTGDLVKLLVGDITASQTTAGLESGNVSMNLWAQGVLDNAHNQFIAAVAAYSSQGKQQDLAKAIQAKIGPNRFKQIFFGTFKGSWWKNLDPEQQIALQEMVDWAAQQIGLVDPSKDVITAVTQGLRGKAAMHFKREFEAEYGKPENQPTPVAASDPIADIVKKMRPSIEEGQSLVDAFASYLGSAFEGITTGTNPLSEIANGMRNAFYGPGGIKEIVDWAAEYTANNLIGQSPPPMGPLNDVTGGGYRTMLAWAQGIMSAIPRVLASTGVVARAAMLVLSPPKLNLFGGGVATMMSWVSGMLAYWNTFGRRAVTTVTSYVRDRMSGQSPPPLGPLKNIDKGGYNTIKAWSQGIERGGALAIRSATMTADRVNSALDVKGLNSGNPISFASSNERRIKVEVDVSSKDGSVGSIDLASLSESLVPELVRSLEHMSAMVG